MTEPVIQAVATNPWVITSSIAAAVSAIFAAIAALVSLCQVQLVHRQFKEERMEKTVLRVFEYSPYSQPGVLEARNRLQHKFSGLKHGTPASLEQIRGAFADKDVLADFNLVLNHWGRLATAQKHDLVNSEVAKDLLKFGFVAFWERYKPYLKHQFAEDESLSAQYVDVQSLYEAWKD